MKKETIASVLSAEGAKSGAKGYDLDDRRDAACFVRGAAEAVVITRIVRVVLREDHAVFETDKGARYFFGYDDVVGLRMNPNRKEEAAGFGR